MSRKMSGCRKINVKMRGKTGDIFKDVFKNPGIPYSKDMDERRRTIREMKEQQREDLLAVDRLLEELGAALLSRLTSAGGAGEPEPGGEASGGALVPFSGPGETSAQEGGSVSSHPWGAAWPVPEDIAAYHQLLREIEGCEENIRIIDAGIIRLKELEDLVRRLEKTSAEETKNLSGLYAQLGELVLEDPGFADLTEPYRKQLDYLTSKVRSLGDRLDVLAERGDAGLFSWIGKNTQTVVIRSFLGKNQKNIRQICTAAGEQFTSSPFREGDVDAGVREILDKIKERRKVQVELTGELTRLQEEQRRIGESLGSEGNPRRRIRTLERQIIHAREQLREVYLRYGARLEGAASSKGSEVPFAADDRSLLDRIRQLRKTVRDYDGQIETLEASLAIDEKREGITKKEKAIAEQQQRIAVSEGIIADLKRQIEEARQCIEELSEKL
jgi:tetratricopeptide (TPR) repeat protein